MLMTRRDFLQSSLAAAGAAGLPLPKAPLAIKKGLVFDMVPGKLPYADRFKLVRDAGFQAVQALTEPDQRKAQAMKTAADPATTRTDSVMHADHSRYPPSPTAPTAPPPTPSPIPTPPPHAQ